MKGCGRWRAWGALRRDRTPDTAFPLAFGRVRFAAALERRVSLAGAGTQAAQDSALVSCPARGRTKGSPECQRATGCYGAWTGGRGGRGAQPDEDAWSGVFVELFGGGALSTATRARVGSYPSPLAG